MVGSLFYRRPSYVTSSSQSSLSDPTATALKKCTTTSLLNGIPEALSLDRILANGTCPPCTTRDFMNYLLYIEHSAENLQFYLWLQDYEKRFEGLDERNKKLSPEWDSSKVPPSEQPPSKVLLKMANSDGGKVATKIFAQTGFCSKGARGDSKLNPFSTPPRTPNSTDPTVEGSLSEMAESEVVAPWSTNETDQHPAEAAAEAFSAVELKWQPFTIQPYREEITRVIALYITPGAMRELNLSTKERSTVLHALEHTTHPSAFREVKSAIDRTLRFQAHPNFIRWTICNGNRPRVIFARFLGVFTIIVATLAAILITLSSAKRGWRALPAIGWVIGIATLFAAWNGMCVVLHGLHHRHLRPWELWNTNESTTELKPKDPFNHLQAEKNSYEDEPWVSKYEKRNTIRKVFDKEVWVEEPMLRQIQDTIFLQSLLLAIISSVILTAFFVCLPQGNLFR